MKTPTILVGAVALFILASAPAPVAAAKALQIDDTNVLFLIDFTVTANNGDYQIPIVASSQVSYNDRVDVMGYTLRSNEAENGVSLASAIVLGTADVAGDRYAIAQNTQEAFTLAIMATFSRPITGDVQALITKFPYWVDQRRTTVHQNQLDDIAPSDLFAD